VPEVTEDTAANLGTPVLASWIGWERFGWYINYPDVFPPKEGWTAFTDAVEAVHQTGNRVLAIPDVTSLSDAASTWKAAEPNVCSDASGNPIEPWAYSECGKSATLFRMDPRASFWREAVLSLLNRLAELGVDALQLDGFPVFGPQACTAEVAGLPGGGGSWWTSCYYDLFDSFRATVRQTRPDLVLTSEGMAEFYIPLFDSFGDPFPTGFSPGPLEGTLVNDHTKAQLIPLWHVVYHDYMFLESGISFVGRTAPSGAVGYGSSRDYYMRGFGLALIWGEMPATWYADEKMSDLNEASEREAARYLQRVVQLRVGAGRPYLMYGSMQRMPTLDVPTFMIPETKSIPYTMADCPAFTSPAILCSLWRAADGDSAYVLTNISSESVNVSLTLDTEAADAAAGGTYSVATTRNNLAEGRLDNVLLPRKLRVDVAPLDVLLIEVQLAADGS
jgi:hypothetical protein